MKRLNASRTWLLTLVILLPSQLVAGNSKPDLDHLRVADSYDIHPQIYFCVNYMDGQKFWAVRVERRDYKLSNDEMIYNYEIYRYIENWVVLDINSQLVCDGSVCRDIALAADGAHRIWVGQDDPIPASGGIPLYMWSPQALDAKADEWWLIADLADWMDIFQAVGDISAGMVTAFLIGPASELQKLTVREALKVTAKDLLLQAKEYLKPGVSAEDAYKQTLKDRARAAAKSLRVHADKDIRIELGSCVDFSEIIAFRDGVSDIQARGEGACRGLYEFYKGGLAQYLISVIEEADPTKFLKLIDEIVDAIAGNPDLAAAMDAVEYWEAIAVMRREGTLDGALDVMQAFCNANQEPKLLAYWNFDEGSGSIASDSSGNGNDGTIYGAAWTAGRIGYALGFDGSNDWVDIPDDISPEYITLGAWIYPTGFDDGPGDQGNAIIQRSTGGAGAPGDRSWSWRLRIIPRSHLAQFQAAGPNTGVPSVVAPTALVQNRWYHLAATYDGNVMKIYVDGELKATNSNLDGPLETYNLIPVAIGCLEGWGLQHFQGIIDEARIYSGALSNSEIKALLSEPDDTDGDGIPDHVEYATGTDPLDDDTDNDGLLDGPGSGEDANANGIVDEGETDPRSADTDGDGIQDGTESGLVTPEGLDTDMTIFVPDGDPDTTTDPTNPDTDGDGLLDGEEDLNGNGAVDPGEWNPNVITGFIDFEPNTLNLKSQSKWITCYIELPEGYDVDEIDVSKMLLDEQIPAELHPAEIGDYDDDGVPDLMVKFDRSAVQEILEVGKNVEIKLTGDITDGTPFEGIDTIRVIDKGKGKNKESKGMNKESKDKNKK